MRPRPVSNPPNPCSTTHVDWLGEPAPAQLHLYEDATREILSWNDSPDVGFTWSVHPYLPVFEERLRAALPLRAARVLHRVRETRGGRLSDSCFRRRHRGSGPHAGAIAELFELGARRAGLSTVARPAAGSPFRRPTAQLSLLP